MCDHYPTISHNLEATDGGTLVAQLREANNFLSMVTVVDERDTKVWPIQVISKHVCF